MAFVQGTVGRRASSAALAVVKSGLVLFVAACLPLGGAQASSAVSATLGKLTQQYRFEIIASTCVSHGMLDAKVVTAMRQSEARLALKLPPGTPIEAAKAQVAPGAKAVAATIGYGSKLLCSGMAKEIF